MGGFADAVKYLYGQFILRDLLSFMTPGAIVVLTTVYFFSRELLSWPIHWLLYIPLFAVFYIVGFAVQCLGEILGLISTSDLAKSSLSQRIGFFSRDWVDKAESLQWWRERYKAVVKFLIITQSADKEWARQQRERLVILKQMCGNSSLAIALAILAFAISYCPLLWVRTSLAIMLLGLPLLASLYWGHRVHVLRQVDMTEEIVRQLEQSQKQN